MAVLVNKSADINIGDANGWNTIETGTNAYLVAKSGLTSTNGTGVYAYSSAFTDTNLNVLDGILLCGNRLTSTGTVSIAYSQDNGSTNAKTITVNASDLPSNISWIFFKFATTLTLDGGADNKVGITSSSSANARFWRTTSTNWNRILRLTATATAAAGDVLYIVGEHTGAGATTTRTVTMNDTASTDYGTGVAGATDNGIEIGDAGVLTFGTAAATNYTLKCSGSINVWGNGTLSIGTTGTPIPRGSTATLTLDCGANVDFGLIINAGGKFDSQGLSRTSGKDIWSCLLNTDEAVGSTSLGVDTDTGWLDNDVIAVASTTRTSSQCEDGTMAADAGASSLTVDGFGGAGGGLANAHSGTSPTQAEIILLTRSIVIQGASAALQGYIVLSGTSTTDIDWTEIKWMGSATSGKRGIDVNSSTTSNNINIQYSSLHHFSVSSSIAFNVSDANADDWTFSNNAIYAIANYGFLLATTQPNWVADSNIFMKNINSNIFLELDYTGGTFTNNRIIGTNNNVSLYLGFTSTSLGTFSGNIIHSGGSNGITFAGNVSGTISNTTIWRMSSRGMLFNGGGLSPSAPFNDTLTIDTYTAFGNSGAAVDFQRFSNRLIVYNGTFNGDTTFSTGLGFDTTSTPTSINELRFINCDFGTVSGIKTAHTTADLNFSQPTHIRMYLVNTKLASATEILNQTNLSTNSFISSQKHDQTAGIHKTLKSSGTIDLEGTIVKTGSQSVRMLPISASIKLESPSFYVAVANGATVTPSVWSYESAAYNGNRMRLIVKRNDAIGITSDTVLDTRTGASDAAWEELTGTTAAATDDGVMEFVVDCDGTAGTGYAYIDTFTAT